MVELGDSRREAGPKLVRSSPAGGFFVGEINRGAERGSKTVSDCSEYYKTYGEVFVSAKVVPPQMNVASRMVQCRAARLVD